MSFYHGSAFVKFDLEWPRTPKHTYKMLYDTNRCN